MQIEEENKSRLEEAIKQVRIVKDTTNSKIVRLNSIVSLYFLNALEKVIDARREG